MEESSLFIYKKKDLHSFLILLAWLLQLYFCILCENAHRLLCLLAYYKKKLT